MIWIQSFVILIQTFSSVDIQLFLGKGTKAFNKAVKDNDLRAARKGYFEFLEFNIVLSALYIIVFFWGIAGLFYLDL